MSQEPTQPNDPKRLLQMALEGLSADTHPRREPPKAADLEAALPQFEILGLIGQGGMGSVFKAREKKLDRVVALKVLPREMAPDPAFEERFLREARAQAALNHPNILTVFDFGESDEFFYIASEFVDGVDLRQLMRAERLSPAEALRFVPPICDALQYAHDRGVVHRDIKPENILVDQDGRVCIADFGLAKMLSGEDAYTLTRTEQALGTPHYMAPEQMMAAGAVDHRADIYALGVVIYEMLTGQLPIGRFQMPSEKVGTRKELDEIVMRALAQAVEDRYQTVGEVKSDVERAEPERPTAVPAASAAGARMSRKPIVALCLIVLWAFVFLGVMWVAMEQEQENARYRQQYSRWEANQFAIEQTEKAGREWTGERMAKPPTPEPGRLASEASTMLVGFSVIMLIVVQILGFSGVRDIRRSGGRLHGLGFAVFMAWVLPLALVDGLAVTPLATIRDHDTQVLAISGAVVVLLALNVWFLAWQYRRNSVGASSGG